MSPQQADDDAILEASRWFARLHSGEAGADDHEAWGRWYSADPRHQRAWQLVDEVRAQFDRVPRAVAGPALNAAGRARRKAVGQLVAVLGIGAGGALAWRHAPWQARLADYRTGVGERREITLPDGSALTLNTASAVDVAFSSTRRLLTLYAGEVLIRTGSDAAYDTHRPFAVATRHGEVRALGTQFTVRAEANYSDVAVLEDAVALQPASGASPVLVSAGHHARLTARDASAPQSNDASVAAWQYGSIIAVDMPLGALVAELSRYRAGHLHCDPAIAKLKVSGAFPIDDTDRALDALVGAFPVRVSRNTRWWVTVQPR